MKLRIKIDIVSFSFALVWLSSDSTSATDCKRCSVELDTLGGCWNQSLTYYTEDLQRSLNDLASSLVHLSRWRQRHDDQALEADHFQAYIFNETLSRYEEMDKDERGPLSPDDLRAIFEIFFNKTKSLEPHYEDAIYLPEFQCPIPCGYANQTYVALFFVLMTAFLLVVLGVLAYMCLIHRKTDSQGYRRSMGGHGCTDLCTGL